MAVGPSFIFNRRIYRGDDFVVVVSGAPMSRSPRLRRPRLGAFASLLLAMSVTALSFTSAASSAGLRTKTKSHSAPRATSQLFPVGTPDSSEPSGMAPPSPADLPGYVRKYVTDFTGTSLPDGWSSFAGMASGDAGSQWDTGHVVVANGLLSLNSWQDPAYNNEWVNGGLCQCALARTYGAYFVRSRVTGPGPTIVELLWPTVGWPPEIDFNETNGVVTGTSATTIWGSAPNQYQVQLNVDMTRWHTWGVIWTPTSVIYTLDGRAWGTFSVPSEVPHVPMTLHLQQQTWCSSNFACPSSPQSSQIDWVAEYSTASSNPVTLSPFKRLAWVLTPQLKQQIGSLARRIQAQGDLVVNLTGFGDAANGSRQAVSLGRQRAVEVERYLVKSLASLGDPAVVVTVTGVGTAGRLVKSATQAGAGLSQRVTANLY